jgi:hypothetical protein
MNTVAVVFARARSNSPSTPHRCHAFPLHSEDASIPLTMRSYCDHVHTIAECEWSLYPDGHACLRCVVAAPVGIAALLRTLRR